MSNHYLRLWLMLLFSLAIATCGYSQSVNFEDGFEDGDFSSDPAWTGDDSLYTITGEDENHLLHLDGNSGDVPAYLSVPSTSINGSWEFYIRLDFSPSSGNKTDVFLMSDIANLEGSVNGYALRAGETGSDDVFRIVRYDDGSEAQSILSGTTDISSGGGFRVKVTRQAGGLWSLEVGEGYDGVSTEEGGTATDNTYSSASYFGVRSTYTSTRSDKFFYDFEIDLPPFTITKTTANDNQVEVSFNRPYEQVTVQITDFFINNDIGSPASLAYPDSQTIVLHYDNPFPSGQHTLTVNDINDLNGEAIETNTTASFLIFDPFESGDMIINEFMYAPPTGQPEYVEVKNLSDKFLNLQNWQIGDDTNIEILSADTLVLPPDDFLVISSDTATLSNIFGDQHYAENNLPTLNNGGDAIKLITDAGEMADSLSYTSGWGGNGVALERLSGSTPGIYPENWGDSPADLGGTPGMPNQVAADETPPLLTGLTIRSNEVLKLGFNERLDSTVASAAANYDLSNNSISSATVTAPDSVQLTVTNPLQNAQSYVLTISDVEDIFSNAITTADTTFTYYEISEADSGDIFVNEFMYDPPSASSEYIELYNHSNKSLDLRNWILSDNRGSPAVITNTSFILPPDSFVVIAPDDNLLTDYPDIALITMNNFPTLNNGSDHILIHDNDSTLLDSLAYRSDWGGTDISLERRTVDYSGTYPSNWGDAPNGFGMPGAPNSIEEDTQPPALTLFSIQASDRLMLLFSEQLDKSAAEETANYLLADGPAITHATFAAPDSIFLTLDQDLQNATQYTLTIENITDIFDNAISPADTSFTFYQVSPADSGDLFINEFNYNPASGETEYIEIYNPTDQSFDLQNWTLSDNRSIQTPITGNRFILPPDSFVVIAPDNTLLSDFPDIALIAMDTFPALNNSGDDIAIHNADGLRLDSLRYDSNWESHPTLERRTTAIPGFYPENWGASPSPSGGTPGTANQIAADERPPILASLTILSDSHLELGFNERIDSTSVTENNLEISDNVVNSVTTTAADTAELVLDSPLQNAREYKLSLSGLQDLFGNAISQSDTTFTYYEVSSADPGDIFVNEFMYNPPSGSEEFVELYNPTSKSFDLRGWTINDNTGSPQTITNSSFIVPPDSFVVIAEEYAWSDDPGIAVLSMGSNFPTLNNNGDQIVVRDSSGVLLDSLQYSNIWGGNRTSLERQTTSIRGTFKENWGEAPDSLGSPGYRNRRAPDTDPPELEALHIRDSQQLLLLFSERLKTDSATDRTNYSLAGRPAISAIDFLAPDSVLISTEETLPNAAQLSFSIQNISDIFDNSISRYDTTFTHYATSEADSGDVFINEFMYNPPEETPEYIELYNPSDKTLNLQDWTINDNTGNRKTIANRQILLPPDTYAALAADSLLLENHPNTPIVVMGSRFPALNNNGDDIVLRNAAGMLLDSLRYAGSWGKLQKGLERRSLELSAVYRANWDHPDNGEGSPGSPNTVASDTTAPALSSFTISGPTSLQLTFSERIDDTSLGDNFVLSGDPKITAHYFMPPDTVAITLSEPLQNATSYTLQVSEIRDLFGNTLSQSDTLFTFYKASSADSGEVFINEFSYNPASGETEYIEIYNPTDRSFELQNWTLSDNRGNESSITDASSILPPDSYVVLAPDNTLLKTDPAMYLIAMGNRFPALNNSGDNIVLKNKDGSVLDSLQYTSNWGGDELPLERKTTEVVGFFKENWGPAPKTGGSPGTENHIPKDQTPPELLELYPIDESKLQLIFSERVAAGSATDLSNYQITPNRNIQLVSVRADSVTLFLSDPLTSEQSYEASVSNITDIFGNGDASMSQKFEYLRIEGARNGDIVINEIMPIPGDGEAEFVELYNRSDKNIDLTNWSVGDASGEATISQAIQLRAQSYLVLTGSSFLVQERENAIRLAGFPNLNNTSDILFIRNSAGTAIDSLHYHASWGADLNGYSLERKDPWAASNDASNWQSANSDDGNSAGIQNASFAEDTSPPKILFAKTRADERIEVQFDEFIKLTEDLQITIGGQPLSVSAFDSTNGNSIILQKPAAKAKKSSQTVTVENVVDIRGNIKKTSTIAVAQPLETGDLVINEIMFNPLDDADDNKADQSEYVELYNTRDYAISLEGLVLHDAPDENGQVRELQPVSTTARWVHPGETVLVYADQAPKFEESDIANFFDLESAAPKEILQIDRSNLSMASDDDAIYIADSTGAAIDSVHYSETWHNPNLVDTRGIALERITPDGGSNARANWSSSVHPKGGTPKAQNSIYQEEPQTPQETGISFMPNPFSPDEDGYEDNLVISYKLDHSDYLLRVNIFDRYGRHIKELADGKPAGFEGSLLWDGRRDDGRRNRIGIYIVVFEAYNSASGSDRSFKKTVVIARKLN